MKNEGYYRKLFLVAALWNFAVGFPLLFAYNPMLRMLGEPVPKPPIYLLLFLALVVVFGWGYFLVYQNPGNRDIVKIGILGKLLVFFITLVFAFKGDIQWITMGLFFSELVFAALFIEFLYTTKASSLKDNLSQN